MIFNLDPLQSTQAKSSGKVDFNDDYGKFFLWVSRFGSCAIRRKPNEDGLAAGFAG
jgi:hypothetical protein